MIKIILILLLLSGSNIILNAQTSKGAIDSATTEIRRLTQNWTKAIINRDSVTCKKILSPEFALHTDFGSIPRKEWIKNLPHLITDTLQFLGEQKITIYGDAAMSEGTMHWKVNNFNYQRNNEYWITDIWKKTNGRWEVLMRMSKLTKERANKTN